MLLAIVPAAPPTRKNQRTTSCPAPISAKVPYRLQVEVDPQRLLVGVRFPGRLPSARERGHRVLRRFTVARALSLAGRSAAFCRAAWASRSARFWSSSARSSLTIRSPARSRTWSSSAVKRLARRNRRPRPPCPRPGLPSVTGTSAGSCTRSSAAGSPGCGGSAPPRPSRASSSR